MSDVERTAGQRLSDMAHEWLKELTKHGHEDVEDGARQFAADVSRRVTEALKGHPLTEPLRKELTGVCFHVYVARAMRAIRPDLAADTQEIFEKHVAADFRILRETVRRNVDEQEPSVYGVFLLRDIEAELRAMNAQTGGP